MLQAIETIYKGYRFRSRLEARWAVFFDALGIKWEYENEGYDLDGVWYLPDFWLPEVGCWVEVKGKVPENYGTGKEITGEEIEKATRLARLSHKDVYILYGPMEVSSQETILGFTTDSAGKLHVAVLYKFARCPVCGRIGLAFFGQISDLHCGCFDQFERVKHALHMQVLAHGFDDPDTRYWIDRLLNASQGSDAPSIQAAYLAAQQARFEHGESGSPR